MAANARRQRQTYDKCGPRMQQAECAPVSRGTSDFITKRWRIGPKRRSNRIRPLLHPIGNLALCPMASTGAIRALFRMAPAPRADVHPVPAADGDPRGSWTRKSPADWILRPSRHL